MPRPRAFARRLRARRCRSRPPDLNVATTCETAAASAGTLGRDKQTCLSEEHTAMESVTKNWSQYRLHRKDPVHRDDTEWWVAELCGTDRLPRHHEGRGCDPVTLRHISAALLEFPPRPQNGFAQIMLAIVQQIYPTEKPNPFIGLALQRTGASGYWKQTCRDRGLCEVFW